ncbi:MAG: hypothetical protein NTZ92_03240 [Candidatus Omnitrophica bacterium]|nr:hypothetical protein [Candidatus Omnitrophota bacterium]
MFNIKSEDVNKLPLPRRKLLDRLIPLLGTIDTGKLNQELSKIEIKNEELGNNFHDWALNINIVTKEEQSPIIEINALKWGCFLKIDNHTLYLNEGAPEEDLFDEKRIKEISHLLNKLLEGFTIARYLDKKGRLRKRVFYYGVDEPKRENKIETVIPTFKSLFLITHTITKKRYIFK